MFWLKNYRFVFHMLPPSYGEQFSIELESQVWYERLPPQAKVSRSYPLLYLLLTPPPPSYNGSGYSSTSNSDGSAPLFTKLSNSHNNTLTIIRLIWTRFSPSRERQASGMEQAINFCQGILVMSSYTERLRALAAVPQLPCMTKDLKWPRFWQPDFLLFQQTSQTSDVICANSRTPPQSPHSVRTFYPIYLWFMNYGLIFPIDLYLIVQNST